MTQKVKIKKLTDVASYEEWLNNLKTKARQKLLSEGRNEKNIKEFGETGDVKKLQLSKDKEKERLICENCKKTFMVEISGNTALFSGENNSGAVIVKFKEMIGICASCIEKGESPDKAYSWLPSKEKRWRYDKKMAKFEPYVELMNYPIENVLEYTRNNPKPKSEKTLETRYKDVVSEVTKLGINDRKILLKRLKKSLLDLPVDK